MPVKKNQPAKQHLVKVSYDYSKFLVVSYENAQKLMKVLTEATYMRGRYIKEAGKTIYNEVEPDDTLKITMLSVEQLQEIKTEAALFPEQENQ